MEVLIAPPLAKTIERIIFEKTSSLLNSNIVVAKQSSNEITDLIKKKLVALDKKSVKVVNLY